MRKSSGNPICESLHFIGRANQVFLDKCRGINTSVVIPSLGILKERIFKSIYLNAISFNLKAEIRALTQLKLQSVEPRAGARMLYWIDSKLDEWLFVNPLSKI